MPNFTIVLKNGDDFTIEAKEVDANFVSYAFWRGGKDKDCVPILIIDQGLVKGVIQKID